MRELTNSCCLHHVSGGWGWNGDPSCPGCNGEWDDKNKNSNGNNIVDDKTNSKIIKDFAWFGVGTAVGYVNFAAGVAVGVTGFVMSNWPEGVQPNIRKDYILMAPDWDPNP